MCRWEKKREGKQHTEFKNPLVVVASVDGKCRRPPQKRLLTRSRLGRHTAITLSTQPLTVGRSWRMRGGKGLLGWFISVTLKGSRDRKTQNSGGYRFK